MAQNNPKIYVLKLYITGMTPNCRRAVENITKFCNTILKEDFDLEVIDMYQEPLLAIEDQIIASPTLVIKAPGPVMKLIGDMSDTAKLSKALNLNNSR